MEWNEFFMSMADTVAQKSKDSSTKVGAVIVGPDNEVRSVGFNGFPRGAIDEQSDRRLWVTGFPQDQPSIEKQEEFKKRLERPAKYSWTEHAERNAIYNAARMGTPLNDCIIYINSLPPCCDCARAIIQSGISEVVIPGIDIPERWKEDCELAEQMLHECGVLLTTTTNKE